MSGEAGYFDPQWKRLEERTVAMVSDEKTGFTAAEFWEAPSKWDLRCRVIALEEVLENLLHASTREILADSNFNLRWNEAYNALREGHIEDTKEAGADGG